MILFLDTSSLFKLYHFEEGTDYLFRIFEQNEINRIYLAELTKIEFASTIWKKCRKGELDDQTARLLLEKFITDGANFSFIPFSDQLSKSAMELLSIYWKKGLRTLDVIQLASALSVQESLSLFLSADNILNEIAQFENLTTA